MQQIRCFFDQRMLILYPMIVLEYSGFILDICRSIHPSVCRMSIFHFWMITRININGFSPDLECALILWRSGLGLLRGKFHQCLTELFSRDTITAGYYSLSFLFFLIFPLKTHCGTLLAQCPSQMSVQLVIRRSSVRYPSGPATLFHGN